MLDVKAIETVYNGYRFRSRLEARWAVFFDTMGIRYVYEPEGFVLSDGTMYLPDFYLPDSDTYVEIKGVMSDKDKHKIEQFMQDCHKDFLIGYEDMHFQASDVFGGLDDEQDVFVLSEEYNSVMCQCYSCGRIYFTGLCGSYKCKCCGYYNGDGTFDAILCGDSEIEPDQLTIKTIRKATNTDPGDFEIVCFPMGERANVAKLKARQARFEHGETPKARG